jgi:hypothetical protein
LKVSEQQKQLFVFKIAGGWLALAPLFIYELYNDQC